MRLDIKKKMAVKHWNEVSEQVVELTSLKYFKSRKDKYPSKMIGGKNVNQFLLEYLLNATLGKPRKNIPYEPFT